MVVESDEIKDIAELLQNLGQAVVVGGAPVKRQPKPDRKRAKTANDSNYRKEANTKLTKEVPKVSENEAKISNKDPTEPGKREPSEREPRSKAVVSLGPALSTRSRVKSRENHSSESKTRNLVMAK